MKFKLFSVLTIAMMLFATLGIGSASASGYSQARETMVVYQNVGTGATTTLNLLFYENKDDTTPVTVAQSNLNQYGSVAVKVGSLGGLPADFQGTAVLVSDQPLAAIMLQVPDSTTVMIRPMSNGFKAGATNSYIANVVRNDRYTKFVVQNTGTTATNVDIKIYNTTSSTPVYTDNQDIQGGAGFYVDTGTIVGLGTNFTGSAVVSSTDGGSIVASAMELSNVNNDAKAFEGLASGALTVYLPSAQCAAFGQTAYFSAQNTSTTTATNITIRYSNGKTETKSNVGPGAKANFSTCTKNAAGFSGSAKVTSSATNVVVLAKLTGGGAATAYMGFNEGAGSQLVALPLAIHGSTTYWNNGTMPHINITIQNIGAAAITGNVLVKYYNVDGTLAGTHTISGGIPVSGMKQSVATSAGLSNFGCLNADCSQVGGSAVIEGPAGAQLAVVARVAYFKLAGNLKGKEDYTGIPIQ